jgi:hypothetical protein
MWTVCMLREDLVDDDVDLLHVERSLSMMCSGSHLYSCYRLEIRGAPLAHQLNWSSGR